MENLVNKYLKKHNMTQTEFSLRVGMSKQLVSWHIQHPQAKWNPADAKNIERATAGEILAYDLVFKD